MELKIWILAVAFCSLALNFRQLSCLSIREDTTAAAELKPETFDDFDSTGLKQQGSDVDVGRQFGPGGGQGGGYQPGGGGGYQNPGGYQPPGGSRQTTEEEGEEEATSPGPGALGILSGLFGIFSGVGGLNYQKVLESTVNFYPPHLKEKAQGEVNRLLGKTTKRPRANTTVIIYVDRSNNATIPASDAAAVLAKVVKTTALPAVTITTPGSTTEDEDEDEDYERERERQD